MSSPSKPQLEPDYAEAEKFLNALGGADGLFTFQTFDDSPEKRKGLAVIRHGSLKTHWQELVRANRAGAGIFVCVNQTDGNGRAAANVTGIRALYADLDGAPLEPVLDAPIAPNIVVNSGGQGRYHAYWLVDGCPIEQFTHFQKQLITRFGADPVIHDLPRVMRIPGFYHCKAEPVLVTIKTLRYGSIPTPCFAESFNLSLAPPPQEIPAYTPKPTLSADSDPALLLKVRKLALTAAGWTLTEGGCGRHNAVVKAAHCLRRDGFPMTEDVANAFTETFLDNMLPSAPGVDRARNFEIKKKTLIAVYGKPSHADAPRAETWATPDHGSLPREMDCEPDLVSYRGDDDFTGGAQNAVLGGTDGNNSNDFNNVDSFLDGAPKDVPDTPSHGAWTTIKTEHHQEDDYDEKTVGVVLIPASSIEPVAVKWLWDGWLPRGKMVILAGKPSAGKTILALDMAATISRGGQWPDGTHAPVGRVIIWTGEDGVNDTIIPRLIACQADLTQIDIISGIKDGDPHGTIRSFDPATDCQHLLMALACREEKPVLMLVDSIASAVAGDGNRNNDTRRGLQPLVDIGDKIGCTILGVTHFTKNSKANSATDRVTGSLAFGALARVVMTAGRVTDNPDEESKRLLTRAKSNLGPDGGGFEYATRVICLSNRPEIETICIVWGNAIAGHSDDIMARTDNRPSADEQQELTECSTWLLQTLKGGGVMKAEVVAMGDKEGYSKDQIARARKKIGVFVESVGYPAKSRWSLLP